VAPLLPTGKKDKKVLAFFYLYGCTDVKLLTKSGEIKQFLPVAPLKLTGKKTKSTDILLSIYGSSYVKLLTKSGEIKQFLSVAPLLPTGIHVTSDNNIILGAVEKVF
jgi:hypothetical protein